MLGLLGKKVGMTRVFRDNGDSVPVTVLDVSGNRVAQVKRAETDGYLAVQVAHGERKRHHFRSNRATHGNSRSTRKPGSIGQRQDPGRVFPGKKMPGHLGAKRRTLQNLPVERVDEARGLLLVRGSVPGSSNGEVMVRPAAKAGRPAQ